MSTTAEIGQIFVPDRVPSLADICSQTLGNVAGILLWAVAGRRLTGWLRASFSERQPMLLPTRILSVYVIGLIIAEILPLDLSMHPWELARKYREGRILIAPHLDRLLTVDSVIDVVRYVPVGALFVWLWTRSGRPRAAWKAVALGALVVASIEALQVVLISRTASSLDVVTGVAGVAFGVAAATLVSRRSGAQASDDAAPASALQAWAFAAALGWVAVLILVNWSPFDFAVDGSIVRQRLPMLLAIPFSSYEARPIVNAAAEAVRKLVYGFPLGVLLALATPRTSRSRRLWLLAATAFAFVVFGAIEAGQVLVPTRYPDSTDVLLGVAASVSGFYLIQKARQ